jgi:plastocyanin domain-containing protein
MRFVSLAALLGVAAAGRVAHADPRHIDITITEHGFEPADVTVPAATPVALVFVRKTDKTCAKQVRLEIDGKRIERELPLDTPVEIDATFPKPGKLTYACGMDMVHGTITVEPAR